MAAPCTSMPSMTRRNPIQTQYRQGTEDFGFDTTPLVAGSSPEINALPPRGTEDFGFDAPFIGHQSETDGLMPREKDDFGFEMDAEFPTEEERVQGTIPEHEDFEMDGPILSDIQGPSSDLLKSRVWIWGQRAPAPRETATTRNSKGAHSAVRSEVGDILLREYEARASILLAEAKRIRQLYSELRQVYNVDAELTDAIEKMTEECGLDM